MSSLKKTEVKIVHYTPKGNRVTYSLSTTHGSQPHQVLLDALYELGYLLTLEGRGEEARQRLDILLNLHGKTKS